MSKLFTSLTTALLLALSFNANAALISLDASLDKNQVVGATPLTSATGSASMTFDTISNQLSWNITLSGLTSNITSMHFHGPATFGQNSGVQLSITNVIDSVILTALQEIDLLNGLWYINVHTELNPAGEIRGQVLVVNPGNNARVPEPSTLLLLASVLAGFGVAGAKRRE